MRKKNNYKRIDTRINLIPLVDLNMLLIGFFLYCILINKPEVLPITMPINEECYISNCFYKGDCSSLILSLFLDEDNKIYLFNGNVRIEDYQDYKSLKEIDKIELRQLLENYNGKTKREIEDLKKSIGWTKMSIKDQAKYEPKIAAIKLSSHCTFLIKPVHQNLNGDSIYQTKGAIYQNIIETIDRMNAFHIQYHIFEMNEADEFLIKNYKSKGEYAKTFL